MYPCPKCGQTLESIHRRSIDRLLCMVVEVRRFMCPNCRWRGNRRGAGARIDRTPVRLLWMVALSAAALVGIFLAITGRQ